MNWRNGARIAPLAVVLVAVGCKDKPPPPSTTELDPSTRLDECEKADGRANADECYEKHAIKTQKSPFCERIVGPRPKNTCWQRVGVATLDVELCAKIDESVARLSCRADVAKKKGDPELCKKIDKPEIAAVCMREVARSKKDPALCDAITIAETRIDCLGAVAVEKPEVCDRLTDVPAKDKCLSRALTAAGAPKDTEGRCDKITDALLKESCWAAIAARQDPLLCEKTAGKHKCYVAAVQASGDETTCPKIPTPEGADVCWQEIALRKHDVKLCEKVVSATDKKACTEAVTSSKPAGKVDENVKKGIARVSPTELTVTREAADALFRDAEISKSVRVVPEVHDGKTVGMKLFGIRAESTPALLGFENGDRLEKVNGFDLAKPEEALEAYTKLAKAAKVDVQLTRKGAPMTLTYTIK